jgi:perosamine synthetase
VPDAPLIPVCAPLLAGREAEYLAKTVASGWISSSGNYVRELEERFAEYLGVKYAVTASSGTAALHLACRALGIGPGDEVLIPDFTMIATAFALCYCGATPVFVDCERETWNMDVGLLERKITKRTRAILPVHIYGHPCDMGAIRELAKRHGLHVLEDAAEAIGSRYRGSRCGAMGDAGCFSFFANKIVTTGEGGLVATDDKELYDRCRYFKNLCFPLEGPRNYVHEEIGFNYRMPNVVAALGVAQLERVEDYTAMRRRNAALYRSLLAAVPGLALQPELPGVENSYWMCGLLVDERFGATRDEVMARLASRGIETRPFFVPMHRQPALRKYGADCSGDYPVADEVSARGLYLPSGSGLTAAEIERVCAELVAIGGRSQG